MENQPEQVVQESSQPTEQVEQQEEVVQEQQPDTSHKIQTNKEENLRLIRMKAEQADRLQKERDDALFRLREYEARYNQQQPQQPVDDTFNVDDDGLVEGKHLKKMYNQMKKLEAQLSQQTQASTSIAVEARLKAQFPDIDAVLSKENIETLRATEPELMQTLDSDTNSYTKLVTAYKFIKNSGIYKDSDMYNKDIERIQNNARKPKPLSSIATQPGNSPLTSANAFANGLTPELKKKLAEDVARYRGGAM